jgi:hypothetical protein
MTFVLTALLLLLLIAFGLLAITRSHRRAITGLDDLSGNTKAVDLAAFQNLIDPAETQFLRTNLGYAQFCILQHQRMLAATEYVQRIAHNAGVLLQLGQLARLNPDPEVATAAQAMVERAAHVRMISMLALCKLYALSVVPALPFATENVFHDYRRLTETAVLFTRLQRPAFAGRVGSML